MIPPFVAAVSVWEIAKMDVLRRQVQRALRRLIFEQFLRALGWSWTATLCLAALGIGVEKYRPLGIGPAAWLVGALAAGIAIALVWTAWRRRRTMDAAIEIDRRFQLKERVSSSLSLDEATRETPVGRALIADAAARVERLHVGEQFRVRLTRASWLPLAPAVVAFLVAWLLNPVPAQQQAVARQETLEVKKQIKTTSTSLEKKLSERRKKAEEEGLTAAEELFKKLEEGTRELADKEQDDRKQALTGLNDLAKELEKRREELAGSKELKEQLSQLENLQAGPADRFAQAVREGDTERALKELEKLQQKLQDGQLGEAEQKQLAQQMQAMAEKLNQQAQKQKEARQKLEQELAKAQKEGRKADAQQMERQLASMSKQAQREKDMRKMAQQCAECAEAMQQGDNKKAGEALADMQSQMESLQREMQELEQLDEAMQEIADAKGAMKCKQCHGAGCKVCQQEREGKNSRPGHGVGRNKKPGPDLATSTYDTSVRQKVKPGGGVMVGEVDGPSSKVGVEQEIQSQFQNVESAAEDPLTGQRLPRGYREHAQKYFDALREGE
ncbi:MAG: hypothetical protein KF708_05970 [Pirellulales bacterium]|nr:hypothetical protein [Pirellulales bacterium]